MKNARLLILVTFLLASAGCLEDNQADQSSLHAAVQENHNVSEVEIVHFHRTSQCWTCKTVGAYAEETVDTYFAEEVASGKLVFKHLNTDLPENQDIFRRYNTTTPSLCIGVYTEDGFYAEQNMNVWYKVNDKEDYIAYLKEVIEKRLGGDMG